jgi:segregation and condensation protein B
VRLVEVAGGWQFRTAPECADAVQRFIDVKPLRLSKAAMETLAIVAYRQPITKPDVDETRGVDSGSAVKLLLDRNLVRVLGRKEEPGRPLLYGTTQAFLEFFNLGGLGDLPSLKEYTELTEEGRRQLERDLFARPPEPLPEAAVAEAAVRAPVRHWSDLVEVLGDDLGELPAGVEVEDGDHDDDHDHDDDRDRQQDRGREGGGGEGEER